MRRTPNQLTRLDESKTAIMTNASGTAKSGAAIFRQLLAGDKAVIAPLVFNPMTARLAEQAGFKALYLGGGSLGYMKCVTEANLSLTEMAQAALDIRTVCPLPLIFDAACGYGEPMHMHRTIQMAEAVGFCAIELEDQIIPKRVHHHIGVEHLISKEEMVAKIVEAVAARRDPDFVIIGRTNASHIYGLDEALRRGEAYRKAGADMIWVVPRSEEETRIIGERLGGPLMHMNIPPKDGKPIPRMTPKDLHALGYRLIADGIMPLLAAHQALRACYQTMAEDRQDINAAANEWQHMYKTVGLEKMLEIERRTVEKQN